MTENVHFSGRAPLLQQLENGLTRHERGRHNHRVGLHGMGGIRKTPTALQYVYSLRDSGFYRPIYWLRAKDQASLLANYQRIASAASFPIQGQDLVQMEVSVLGWLREQDEWLLVLDDLDNIQLLPASAPNADLVNT